MVCSSVANTRPGRRADAVPAAKMPYHLTVTWLDGKSLIELIDIQANVAVDAAKFAKPSAPVAPPQ